MQPNNATVTRYVSFFDDAQRPLRLRLAPDQEVVGEEEPEPVADGRFLRSLFVRGPLNRPIHLLRQELLPDGSVIWVRYNPETDLPFE